MLQIVGKRFLKKDLRNKISETNYDQMIIMGELNGVINPTKDRTGGDKRSKNFKGKLPKSFFELLEEENLIDIWRLYNSASREFTFYSNRHKSHSRIDFILMTKSLTLSTKTIEILPQVISDHNTVVWMSKKANCAYQWRLNEQLLSKDENL